jgi:hypothetical protein
VKAVLSCNCNTFQSVVVFSRASLVFCADDLLSDGGDFGAFEGYTSDASSGIGSLASSDIASLQMPSAASQLNPSVPLQTQHISSDLADLQPNVSNGQGQGQGQGASKKSKDDILKLYSGMTAAGTPAMMPPAGLSFCTSVGQIHTSAVTLFIYCSC